MNQKISVLQCDKCGDELERNGQRMNSYYIFKDLVSGGKYSLCVTCAGLYSITDFCQEVPENDIVVEAEGVVVGEEATPEEVENFFTSDEPVFAGEVRYESAL